MYIINPTVGHDCTLAELKRGLISVDVIEKKTKKHRDFEGIEYVFYTVMINGYIRYYPSCRLTTDQPRAEITRQAILTNYK